MIHSFEYCQERIGDLGKVVVAREGIVMVEGLKGGVVGESVAFEGGARGMILSFTEKKTEVLAFSREPLCIGTKVARTGHPVTVSCGGGLLGHLVSALGYVEDDRREQSHPADGRQVDTDPSGILARRKINKFLTTGMTVVDLMVPIGRGQRELVIGDRKTGKSQFILQTVLTQATAGTICIIALIGKRKREIEETHAFLTKHKVMKRCILVASTADASAGEVYLTPYTALTLAEYFRDQGKETLVILDDLTTHAKYYREIALVSGRFPGRESYPGEIFFVQARLMERAGNFFIKGSEASLTLLPVAETVEGDLTGYIQTNLMSMTDGHIFFDRELYFKGVRPAINIFLSVTRTGRQTQTAIWREMASQILSSLKQAAEASRFLRFGPEATPAIQSIVARGQKISEFFTHEDYTAIPASLTALAVALIYLNRWSMVGFNRSLSLYKKNQRFRSSIDKLVAGCSSFSELKASVRRLPKI